MFIISKIDIEDCISDL